MRVYLLHEHYDVAHLEAVKDQMAILGAPVIRAVYVARVDAWVALEGCHRLRAAHDLGITPEIEEVEYSEDALVRDIVGDPDIKDDVRIDDYIDNLNDTVFLDFNEEV